MYFVSSLVLLISVTNAGLCVSKSNCSPLQQFYTNSVKNGKVKDGCQSLQIPIGPQNVMSTVKISNTRTRITMVITVGSQECVRSSILAKDVAHLLTLNGSPVGCPSGRALVETFLQLSSIAGSISAQLDDQSTFPVEFQGKSYSIPSKVFRALTNGEVKADWSYYGENGFAYSKEDAITVFQSATYLAGISIATYCAGLRQGKLVSSDFGKDQNRNLREYITELFTRKSPLFSTIMVMYFEGSDSWISNYKPGTLIGKAISSLSTIGIMTRKL